MKTVRLFRVSQRTLLLAVCFTALLSCTKRSGGVDFYTGSWQGLLAEAKKQNKPIFVDVHTAWCGPCRMMEKEAFPDPTVGKKLNPNFINYSVDMEKGEGLAWQKKYAITAIPTLLFLSPNGELVYRTAGYEEKDGVKALLTQIDKALDMVEQPSELTMLETQYAAGKRDVAFLRHYLTLRARMGLPNEKAMEAFIQLVPQRDWKQTMNLALITKNTLTDKSPSFDYILRYADSIRADRDKQNSVWLVVNAVSRVKSNELAEAKTEADVDRVIALDHKIGNILSNPPQNAATKAYRANKIRREYYEHTKNQDGYRTFAVLAANRWMTMSPDSLRYVDARSARMAKQPTNQGYARHQAAWVAGELNKLVKAHMNVMSNPADLNQALTWSSRALVLMPYWEYMDDHAHLLARLGRRAEAIRTEKEAIAKARAANESTAEYQKTLARWQKQINS